MGENGSQGVQVYDLRLSKEAVIDRYKSEDHYRRTDTWHQYTAHEIRHAISLAWLGVMQDQDCVVLNAGAGNSDLGILPPSAINLDISQSGVAQLPNGIIASIENMPLDDRSIDVLVCVGSVINYCDAAAAISEFARVLRPNGRLVLEFESSLCGEFFGQDCFGRSATIVETFYGDGPETLWVYRPEYIGRLLQSAGFSIVRKVPIHILSPWLLLLTGNPDVATSLAHWDRLFRRLPLVTRWASNHLLFCQKST